MYVYGTFLYNENHRINNFDQLHRLTDWMKTNAKCSKCQTSSVIEGCVQELLDPSLAASCCMQTSTETRQRVLASRPPTSSSSLTLCPASLLMTSALSTAAPSST